MKKGHNKVTFKPYTMDQPALLPPTLDELIPEDHLVWLVNQVMDELVYGRVRKGCQLGVIGEQCIVNTCDIGEYMEHTVTEAKIALPMSHNT